MTPHGNSNKNEPFFRTKPSVREDIQKKIEVEKPHIVYKNLVCENVEGHDAISKPRNIKQLHNAKASKQEEIRLTRDAIYNTHELAYEGGFIHFLSTYPDLCVVAGEVEMIQELNSVIQLKDEDLLLSYDTTFNLGEFYVSPLVFKHVVFTDNPLVAGLFLIHERKLSETHEHFFKILSSLVKPLKGVPIVTDMESAIVKAIRENTTLKQIGCWRHLRQDVQRWLTDNLPKVERSTYVNELYEILRTTTERQCADMIKKMEKQWNEEFTRYFKKSVEPKLGYFCAWSIANSCKLDTKNGITNLMSSTPKSPELLKDVRYSLEVWVPADKQKLFHNLNVNDRNLIQKRSGWMNDTIIDSAMNLLQFQFPDLEGFQSCTLAVQLDFQRHEKLFIQIINRSPNTKGTHWLTVSNINCMEDEVGVYDTAFDDLPHIEQLVVASLVKTEQKVLKVKFSNVYMQTNGNDCFNPVLLLLIRISLLYVGAPLYSG